VDDRALGSTTSRFLRCQVCRPVNRSRRTI
jgi:hypothetical protein